MTWLTTINLQLLKIYNTIFIIEFQMWNFLQDLVHLILIFVGDSLGPTCLVIYKLVFKIGAMQNFHDIMSIDVY